MGKEKAGFLTPKAIANRIKAKGLQKLRWYCQMCQKQCRDENGFKCHMTSESHQRQLLLFAENPDQYIDDFSKEFEDDYLEVLRRRCGTKRIHANIVYQDYISNKDHVHMNSTKWETLTDFVKYLGREGKCVVDETEKGWFVQYIDRDPETIKKMEASAAKEKMEMDDEERTSRFIQKQIEKAAAQEKEKPATEFTELQRENDEDKVTFSLGLSKKENPTVKTDISSTSSLNMKKEKPSSSDDMKVENTKDVAKARVSRWADMEEAQPTKLKPGPGMAGQKRKSALDEIREMEEKKKEKMNRKDYWLHKRIVVKLITKKLGERYHKKKAVVLEVKDLFTATVKMLDSEKVLKVDQTHVETVIPALGKHVMIVNGAYRGQEAKLTEINEKKFSCTVTLSSGPLKGRVLENIQYEDISKLHVT